MPDLPRYMMGRLSKLYGRSRERKLELFFELTGIKPGANILDIGATAANVYSFENMLERMYADRYRITTLSLDDAAPIKAAYPGVECVQGDGCRMPFKDGAFDTVFSNAVIEHVGPEAVQRTFIHEIVRVGRTGFVTTPNYWFPIEQHTTMPFVQFLPWSLRAPAIRMVSNERRVEYMRHVHLLSSRRFLKLFPGHVNARVLKLRTTFWPEQLIAYYSH